jgi:lipopolysaccharide/colanic/teichoic acid biosynthesis glycosyltransferase
MYREFGKRLFDLLLVITGLAMLVPILVVLGLFVSWRMGSPVLFRQRRPGIDGRTFTLLKLRTMKDIRNNEGLVLPDDERLTRFGRFLRRTSLDELPELFCVLTGEMSLVGPRPLLMEYLERYTEKQARRHEVKPGITGWAQVNGRNALSWEEKFDLDVWYVDNLSFWLDMKILAMTAWQVVAGKGISAEGHATMPVFEGTAEDER